MGTTTRSTTTDTVAFRTCPLCEAGCGLEITVRDGAVVRIRGDRDDVFSHGYLCPKGSTLRQLHEDPDRLRRPLVRRDGVHVEVDWADAWAYVADRLGDVFARHGRDAVGVYLGNPNAHGLGAMLYNRSWLAALGSKRRFSASTVDQIPRQVASGFVYGSPATVPVPDLDRTDYLVLVGANPYASNGSLCTAPDFPGRLEAIRERGGRVIVVDPRRTRTAEAADRWLKIRPGTDALLLAAIVATLDEEGLVTLDERVAPVVSGVEEVVARCRPFRAETVADATGLSAEEIRTLARELAAAPSASVYGRIGVCTSAFAGAAFGTAASWLTDVVNLLTGNLDTVGGAMFPNPVAGSPNTRGPVGRGKGFSTGRGHTVARGLPEVMGEYPAAAMAEEILDAGDRSLKAMITVAGNPVLSTPNSGRLAEALDSLEFMVSVDMYLNETTRHADVVLPPPSQLQRSHYDLALLQFAVRNVANYSPAVLPLEDDQPDEWEILARLGTIAAGLGPDADLAEIDAMGVAGLVSSAVADRSSPVYGREVEEIIAMLGDRPGPERLLDVMLQTGPYGAAFGARPGGVSLQMLLDHPHGVDMGALEPRLPEVLRTPSGTVELAHPALVAELERLASTLASWRPDTDGLLLVGRRDLRSNNSWMHNVGVLVSGRERCTLQVHPTDAVRLGLVDGGTAAVTSSVGELVAPVEITDVVREGVVSLPHGWGHDLPGTRLAVAATRPGVNSNVLTDHQPLDPLSGNAVLNGIPVRVRPA